MGNAATLAKVVVQGEPATEHQVVTYSSTFTSVIAAASPTVVIDTASITTATAVSYTALILLFISTCTIITSVTTTTFVIHFLFPAVRSSSTPTCYYCTVLSTERSSNPRNTN